MSRALVFLGLAVGSSASAGIYTGTPSFDFQITRASADFVEGSVVVEGVRIHKCGGGHDDYAIDDTFDPVKGFSVTVNGGDLCSAEVFWDSDIEIEGSGFDLEATPATTSVALDAGENIDNTVTPWKVVAGSMPSSSDEPVLEVALQ